MKKLIIILTLFLFFLNGSDVLAANFVTKEYKIVTNDNFTISATLNYPKDKNKKEFSTVVLLHSLGYNSEWWGTLPEELIKQGYAVLSIDLRGHGKSIYNSKLNKVSWKNLTNKAYKKYPSDVISVLDYVKTENKRVFFNDWAFIGADIGASTAIMSAHDLTYKPKTIVILSPVTKAKGLYVPIKLAEINDIDILSIVGKNDITSIQTNQYLKKFAQSTYAEYNSSSSSTGMIMLKHDNLLNKIIISWLSEYLK